MDKVNESILSETILEDMKENRIDHSKYNNSHSNLQYKAV